MDHASEKRRSAAGPKEQRRDDLALVTSYHEAQLAKLLERVQEGFRRFEAGEISAFELDDLIHHYERAARELWKFCGDLSGSRVRFTARTLEELGEDADSMDWWERGNPKRPGRRMPDA
jgi:hypothetical protein